MRNEQRVTDDEVNREREFLSNTRGYHGCFFFFQAEDGIRVVAVTGVQTCALPIYCRIVANCAQAPPARSWCAAAARATCRASVRRRSEERRVGKECRSRWSPY